MLVSKTKSLGSSSWLASLGQHLYSPQERSQTLLIPGQGQWTRQLSQPWISRGSGQSEAKTSWLWASIFPRIGPFSILSLFRVGVGVPGSRAKAEHHT